MIRRTLREDRLSQFVFFAAFASIKFVSTIILYYLFIFITNLIICGLTYLSYVYFVIHLFISIVPLFFYLL